MTINAFLMHGLARVCRKSFKNLRKHFAFKFCNPAYLHSEWRIGEIFWLIKDWTIRSWDLDSEHTYVLYSPSARKSENAGGGSIEVHIALTPLKPWIFFAGHKRLSVNGRDFFL